jgi:predicted ester cyclase
MKKCLCVVPLVLVFCFSFACQDKAAMAELENYRAQAAVEARNIEVIKTAIAEVDNKNLGAFQTYLAPEFKCYAPSNSTTPVSRDDYMAMVKMMTTAIPDMMHNITELLAVKDRVVMRVYIQGTHLAELGGIPPTGKKVSVSFIAIFRLKDGQVVEEIAEEDFLGLYRQLGMELKPIEAKKK